ncbi:MAG: hypothetical protein OEW06_13020, partial [Gemmatimonadota bacterium]|nr:hypothetical protein [Gemmatimonadota bacterium]
MTKRHLLSHRGMVAVGWLVAGLLACTESQPTSPTDTAILAAKGSGGGGPGVKVNVDQADPSEAPQDTMLTVDVIGSGFDDGSVASWVLPGGTSLVTVDSTTFVDDTRLKAHIKIPLEADVALYDVEVMTRRGKKGIGSELFSVKQKGAPSDTPVSATFRDAPGDGVQSDGAVPAEYTDAVILAIGNLFVDARGATNDRKFCFDFPDQPGLPADVCDDGYFSTADPTTELLLMDPGRTMTTRAQVTWVRPDASGKGYNWALRFGMDCDLNDVTGNRLTVVHAIDGITWTLEGTSAILCQMPTKGKPQVTEVDGS